jgi:molybdopterin synthase sulfur carrier subunit
MKIQLYSKALLVLFRYNLLQYNYPKRGIVMVTIEFLGPIQKAPLTLEAASLRDVAEVLKQDSEMAQWLENCAVAVNDTLVATLDTPLKSGDKVSLLPPVCGG